nr:uncharacterized protein LOC104644902 [Solanum lycopersicum]
MQSTQAKYISLLPNSIRKTSDFSSRNLALNHSNSFSRNGVLPNLHLRLQKPIVSAWKKKKPSGSVRSTKIMLESAYFIASKLKLLPEPLDSIIREFGGGNGGGGGFRFGLEIDVFLGGLGLTLFGFSVNVWKRGILDWALGFCCCAALVGLLLKQDLQKLVSFLGNIKIARRKRKRRLF